MPTWPAAVPPRPGSGAFRRVAQDNVLRFSPDVGDDIRRRRTTAKSQLDTFSMVMNGGDVVSLVDFYETDCEDGSLSFTFTDPIDTSAQKTYAWASPPEIEHLSYEPEGTSPGEVYRVTVSLIRQAE